MNEFDVDRSIPVGTLDELEKLGEKVGIEIDPAEWGTCSRPQTDGRGKTINVGCPMWDDCIFTRRLYGRFKGQGPHYVLVLVHHRSNNSRARRIFDCMQMSGPYQQYLTVKKNAERALAIIGQEGHEYPAEGTKNVKRTDGRFDVVPVTGMTKVPAYPRPGEVGSRLSQAYLTEEQFVQQSAEQMEEEQTAQIVGALAREPRVRKMKESDES